MRPKCFRMLWRPRSADAHALDIDAAPAAELGAEREDAPALDARGQGGAFVDAPEHDVVGRAEGRRRRHGLPAHLRIGQVMHVGGQGRIHRMAGGVHVDRDVHMRQDHAVDEMRQHLRERAARIAREAAVHVAVVDRRQARVVEHRRDVDGRHHDDAALDRRRIERPREARDRDLALVFVAMDAAGEQDGRPVAVLHQDDRDLDRAPAGRVARQRRAQIARLAPRLVEIDVAADPALGRKPPLHPPTFLLAFCMIVYDFSECQAV